MKDIAKCGSLLECQDFCVGYGGPPVLTNISFNFRQNVFYGLTGNCGCGKTTFLNAIIGWAPFRAGRVVFDGDDITNCSTHRIMNKGIRYVTDDRGNFGDLSVRDNLKLAQTKVAALNNDIQNHLFNFPGLASRLDVPAKVLSGGEQRLLAFLCALLARPRLILIDEFSEGLDPVSLESVTQSLQSARIHSDLTVIVADQSVGICQKIVDCLLVLQNGKLKVLEQKISNGECMSQQAF
jgi:ABC-type branched-subunit amino acid transport system ATPase component